MDSRKILEIYKRINDRSIRLVSSWPTVADIPPGMLVLDADGMVKQKVGDYLIPAPVTIIGSGPLASAPVASADNQNMYYMSTDFGLCLSRPVVELNGPDTINYPILATDLMFVTWEIEWVCNDLSASQVGPNRLIQILSSAAGNGTSALVYKNTPTGINFEFRKSAGVGLFSVRGTVPATGFFKIKIKKNGTTTGTCQLYVNDILQGTSGTIDYSSWSGADQITTISMVDTTSDIRPYQVANYKGIINGVLTDCIPMNEISGTSLANQCSPSRQAILSDSTAHAYSWVPWSLLQ